MGICRIITTFAAKTEKTDMIITEVLIIGAGPAGSVCASLLKQKGKECLLVDQATFPRDKICGGGLTPKSWQRLEQLLPGIKYDYHPVKHIRLAIDGKFACEFDSEQELRIVKRRDFDHLLLQYYLQQGGQLRKDAPANIQEQSDGTIIVTMKSGEQIQCRHLVGADGSNSFVRHYLTGNKEHGILAMEQYMEKGAFDARDDIFVELSCQFDKGGYFYRFPNSEKDVVGYGDASTTPERFREVLHSKGIAEGKFRGAFIYLSNDYPLHEHIILIGDAGGFANRVTCEGLFDAFETARHAATAIVEGTSFSQTNRPIFQKMKKEERLFGFFFSPFSLKLMRTTARLFPRIIKFCFDAKMKRESFLR